MKKIIRKFVNTFDHNFKNITLYIMRKVSLERYYFVLYDGALTLTMSKIGRFTRFAIKLFICIQILSKGVQLNFFFYWRTIGIVMANS